jgi:glycosyltransferase involved in cell wall biosynthesis
MTIDVRSGACLQGAKYCRETRTIADRRVDPRDICQLEPVPPMPRILFNMPSQYAGQPSGVARMALELLNSLIGRGGFEYILRSPWSREDLPEALKAKHLELITVPRFASTGFGVLQQTLTFPWLCRRHGIDLVVNLDPFGSATGGRARMMIVHDIYFRTIPTHVNRRAAFTHAFIMKLMNAGSSEIVTVSEATKRDLEFWYPGTRGRVTTIYSATSIQPVAGDAPQEVAGPYVIAVGNPTENKNFGVLAEAMAIVHQSNPDVSLVHVGDDRNAVIAETLKRLGSQLPLIRLSGIDDCRLAALYRHAVCLCVPSLYEGFCLPVLEAQVCGCPVVCSDRSATPEIAGKGAMLFNPTSRDALVDCLTRVLGDSATRDELIRLGRENASRFSWDRAAHQYQAIFDRLLAKS